MGRIPTRRLGAFVSPALPLAAIGLPFSVHLPPYYAGELGLSLGTVGFLFFIVRAIDLPLDPVLGHWIDRTRTRWGRFRPWFVAGAATLVAASYLVFMAPQGLSAIHAFWSIMLLYLGLSMFQLSHQSWAATLSEDYDQRSRVFGWLQATGVFGMVLVLLLPPIAAKVTGDAGRAAGVHAMGWFVIAVLPLAVLLTLGSTREAPRRKDMVEPRLLDMLALLKNRLMARLLVADLLAGIAPGISGAMFLFYFEHRLGFDAATASLLLLLYFVAGLAAAPLWMKLAYRIGKHRAASFAGLYFVLTNSMLLLLPTHSLAAAAFGMAVAGVPFAAFPFLMRAMLADVIDTDRLTYGADRTGLFSAVLTTTSKIAHALPIGVIYPLLGWMDFHPEPGAVNAPEAIAGMTALFIGAPGLVMAGAAWTTWRWPHDAQAHAAVQAALAQHGEAGDGAKIAPSEQLGEAAAAVATPAE